MKVNYKLARKVVLFRNKKKSLFRYGIISGVSLAMAMFYFGSTTQDNIPLDNQIPVTAFPIVEPTLEWGFAIDTMQVDRTKIESGTSLSDILVNAGLSGNQLQMMITKSMEVFDVTSIRTGNDIISLDMPETEGIDYLVYEPSVFEYYLFSLQGEQKVEKVVRPVSTKMETASGIIEGSLWNAMVERGYSYELCDKMEDALKWSVDFHHLQPDDQFRLVFEQKYVEGKPVGVGQVMAAQYFTKDTVFHSIYFEGPSKDVSGYYDENGLPMNAGFLKAPVKYSRISSYYSLNRLHPVLKYSRPHYGTDYAAPYGTPIIAVGNGVVTHAERKGGNGNYVKIKHNDTYETQYLHMQGFADGIRPGVRVRQGDVIGYVGSTGLATGPHVCFRFWKNGEQVNHLKLDLPPAEPLVDSLMVEFKALRDEYLALLKNLHPTESGAKAGNP